MGVLAQWALRVQEMSQRDESMPVMASVSGMAILLLGITLHGVLVAQKGDLVPLFERPLAEGEHRRVARVLEEESAAYVFSPAAVLVSSKSRGRILERLGRADGGGADPDPLVELLTRPGDRGASGEEPESREARSPSRGVVTAASSGAAGTGAVVVVERRDAAGTAPAGWPLYNLTCDDEPGGRGAQRLPAPRDGILGGR